MSKRGYVANDDLNDIEPPEHEGPFDGVGNSTTEGSNTYLNEMVARAITLGPELESKLWSGMAQGLYKKNFVGLRDDPFPGNIPGVHTYSDARDLIVRGSTGRLISAARHIGVQADDRQEFYDAHQALQMSVLDALSHKITEDDVFGPSLVGKVVNQVTHEFRDERFRAAHEHSLDAAGMETDESEETDLSSRPGWVQELGKIMGTSATLDWYDKQMGSKSEFFKVSSLKNRLSHLYERVEDEGSVSIDLFSPRSNGLSPNNDGTLATGVLSEGGTMLPTSSKQSAGYPYQVSITPNDIPAIQSQMDEFFGKYAKKGVIPVASYDGFGNDFRPGNGEGLYPAARPLTRLEQFHEMVEKEGLVPVGLYSSSRGAVPVRGQSDRVDENGNPVLEDTSRQYGKLTFEGKLKSVSTVKSRAYPYQVAVRPDDLPALEDFLGDKKTANTSYGSTLRNGVSEVISAQKGYSSGGEDTFDLAAEDNFSYFNMDSDARRNTSVIEGGLSVATLGPDGKPIDPTAHPELATKVVASSGVLTGGERVGTRSGTNQFNVDPAIDPASKIDRSKYFLPGNEKLPPTPADRQVASTESGFPLTVKNSDGSWITNAPYVEERRDDISGVEARYTLQDVKEAMSKVRSGTYDNWYVPKGVKAPKDLNSRTLLSDQQIDAFGNILDQGLRSGGYGSMPRLAYLGDVNKTGDQKDDLGKWRSEYAGEETLRLQRLGKGNAIWGKVGAVVSAYMPNAKQNEAQVAKEQAEAHFRDIDQTLKKINAIPEFVPHEQVEVNEPAAPTVPDKYTPVGSAVAPRDPLDKTKTIDSPDPISSADQFAASSAARTIPVEGVGTYTVEEDPINERNTAPMMRVRNPQHEAPGDFAAISGGGAKATAKAVVTASAARQTQSAPVTTVSPAVAMAGADPVLSGVGNSSANPSSPAPASSGGFSQAYADIASIPPAATSIVAAVNASQVVAPLAAAPVQTPAQAMPAAQRQATSAPASVAGVAQAAAGILPAAQTNAYANLPAALQNVANPPAERFEIFAKGNVANPAGGPINESYLPVTDHDGSLMHNGAGQPYYGTNSGAVTNSVNNVERGAKLAEEAVNYAFNSTNTEGLSAEDLPATIWKSVTNYIRNRLSNELSSPTQGPDAQRVVSIATADARGAITSSAKVSGLDPADMYEGYSSTPIKSKDAFEAAVKANPSLQGAVDRTGRSIEDLLNDKDGVVISADDETNYTFGGGSHFGNRGSGKAGRGGRKGSNMQSPYQQDFGRIMQSVFMGEMAWKETGGKVVEEARAFGMEESNLVPALNYGAGAEGGQISGAANYSSQASRAKFNIGQAAYAQWGSAISGFEKLSQNRGLVTGVQAGGAALGAGAVAGFATHQIGTMLLGAGEKAAEAALLSGGAGEGLMAAGSAIGAAALPVGLVAATAIGGYAAISADSSAQVKDLVMSGGKTPSYVNDPSFKGMWQTAIHDIPSIFAENKYNAMTPEAKANAAKQYGLQDQSTALAEKYSLDQPQTQADLSYLTQFTGGDANTGNNIVGGSINTGEAVNQFTSEINQVAAGQGALQGSPEWNAIANKFSTLAESNVPGYRQALKDEGQQSGLRASFADMITPGTGETQEGIANMVAKTFGLKMTGGQAQAMTTRMSAGVASGQNTGKGYAFKAAADIMKYGQAGSNAIGSYELQGGQYSPETAARAGGWASSEMDLGYNAVDITSQFGKYQGGPALDAMANGILGLQGTDFGHGGFNSFTSNTMDRLGLFKGDTAMQKAYQEGGTWGTGVAQREKMFGFQMASIGIGFAQNQQQKDYLWGGAQGGTPQDPTTGSIWGIQDRQISTQWTGTLAQEKHQVASQQNQYAQFEENKGFQQWSMGFGYQTNLIERGFERQQFQFNRQQTNQQYGWQQQDIDEQIRRSSGYDRALLVRQKGRENLSHNQEVGQMDKTQTNQETLWKRQDEEYNKQVGHVKTINDLQEKQFAAEKKELQRQIKETEELHKLQLEMITAERANQEKSLEFQKMSLGIQAASAQATKDYATSMDNLSKNIDTWVNGMKDVSDAAPAIITAMEKIAELKDMKVQILEGYNTDRFVP